VSLDDPVARLRERLHVVRGDADHFIARCPAHPDRRASLSVRRGRNGCALVRCFAGCATADVLAAVGQQLRDLFPAGQRNGKQNTDGKHVRHREGPRTPRHNAATVQHRAPGRLPAPKEGTAPPIEAAEPAAGCTLAQYATSKKLPLEFLRTLGLTDMYMGRPVVRISYRGPDGAEIAVRFRVALAKPAEGDDDRFRWRSGSKVKLYGLWRLPAAREAGYAVLVEGESDCHTLWHHGVPTLGIPGARNWQEEWAAHLDGIGTIYVVIEADTGGEAVLKWLAKSRLRERVRLVRLAGAKDPSELHGRDPDGFRAAWDGALAASVPWSQHADAESRAATRAAWEQCRALAREPDILRRVVEILTARGVVGEERAIRLVYLAVTSRLLARPVSVAVKGPSSGGKSFLVERVLGLFPPSAFYALTAMSERALAYGEEPLAHRMLVLYEAAGMASDIASYLMRSLLSEGCVRYETVEKTAEGMRARLIEREGPTGLLVTTTATALHPENETRLLSLTVSDSPEQTRRVLAAIADENRSQTDEAANTGEWHALQAWLEGAEQRVTIPFADELASKIPPVAVRLRRDFGQVLALVRAHAVLHQATREKDTDGSIVAMREDYAAVRELVADLVAAGVDATVPETVRETVAAVRALCDAEPNATASLASVAARLGLDKSAASRRVQEAVRRSWLVNEETQRGRPARLRLGEPLPADTPVLPPPEALQCCSVGTGVCPPAPPAAMTDEEAPLLPVVELRDPFEDDEPDDITLDFPDLEPVPVPVPGRRWHD